MTVSPNEHASNKPGRSFLPPDSALLDVGSHVRLWLLAIAGLAADLWSKHWAFATLSPQQNRPMIPGVITFIKSYNDGALFGIGPGMRWVFVAASVLAFGFVLYLFSQSSQRRWSLHLALGMILGGAMGNLYDRAVFAQVRDFIKFVPKIGPYDVWPWVFNVADALLVVGVGILLVNLWLDKRAAENAAAQTEKAEPTPE